MTNEPIWDNTSSDLDIEPLPCVAADKDDQPELTRAKYRQAFNENKALRHRTAELEIDLGQALRQWKMYAEIEERDLASEKSLEADLYRAALSHAGPVAREGER